MSLNWRVVNQKRGPDQGSSEDPTTDHQAMREETCFAKGKEKPFHIFWEWSLTSQRDLHCLLLSQPQDLLQIPDPSPNCIEFPLVVLPGLQPPHELFHLILGDMLADALSPLPILQVMIEITARFFMHS